MLCNLSVYLIADGQPFVIFVHQVFDRDQRQSVEAGQFKIGQVDNFFAFFVEK